MKSWVFPGETHKYLDFGKKGAKSISVKVKSNLGGTILVHADSKDGKVIGKIVVPAGTDWTTITSKIKRRQCKGVHAIWLTFDGTIDPEDEVRAAAAAEKDEKGTDYTFYSKMLEWQEVVGEMPEEVKMIMEYMNASTTEQSEETAAAQAPVDEFELMSLDWIKFNHKRR